MGMKEVSRVKLREFPGSPVVRTPRTPCFHCRGPGLIPGQGTKVPHDVWHGQKKKKKKRVKLRWMGWMVVGFFEMRNLFIYSTNIC